MSVLVKKDTSHLTFLGRHANCHFPTLAVNAIVLTILGKKGIRSKENKTITMDHVNLKAPVWEPDFTQGLMLFTALKS